MRIIGRARGASLIETMIAVGILGAIAYFVTGMIRNGTMGQRALQSSDDARTMTDNMAAILSDTVACGNTFVPSGTPTYDPSRTGGESISQIKDGVSTPAGGNVAYQVNSKYSTKALTLESITLGGDVNAIDAKSGIKKWTPTATGGTAFVQVVWAQANPSQNGGSPQKLSKFFLLNALTLTGTKIASCQAQAMGGSGSGLWTKTGSDIYNNNAGSVMIGIQSPTANALFDVWSSTKSLHGLFVDVDGNVGVGTSSPTMPLHLKGPTSQQVFAEATTNGGTSGMRLDAKSSSGAQISFSVGVNNTSGTGYSIYDNNGSLGAAPRLFVKSATGANSAIGIGNDNPGYALDVTGDVQAVSFISSSDERLKTDIHSVEGLSKILSLRGVRFRWIKDGVASIGLIAQEVEKVFPELVSTSISTGLKAVRYDALVGPLVEAVKELYGMVQAHERRIAALESGNAAKDAAIRELSRKLEEQGREISVLLKKDEVR